MIDITLTYATTDDLSSYPGASSSWSEDVLRNALFKAENDIDTLFTRRPIVAATGRRWPLDRLSTHQVRALQIAACAQAVFRIERGDEYFDGPTETIQGPDYTIETGKGGKGGAKSLLSPLVMRTLLASGLIPRAGRARA